MVLALATHGTIIFIMSSMDLEPGGQGEFPPGRSADPPPPPLPKLFIRLHLPTSISLFLQNM